jgi:hypothetical protein
MSLALYQYDQARPCTDPNTTSPCIHTLPGQVSAAWREDDRSKHDLDYVLTIALRETGQRVEVWKGQPTPDFPVGAAVRQDSGPLPIGG